MKRFTAREILFVLSDVAILFSFLNVLQTDKSITHQKIKYCCLTS